MVYETLPGKFIQIIILASLILSPSSTHLHAY